MELFIFFTALTILAFAANIWGADTLDSHNRHDDPWERPVHHV